MDLRFLVAFKKCRNTKIFLESNQVSPCKLNVHKTFRSLLGHFLNVLCTFNLHLVCRALVRPFWDVQFGEWRGMGVALQYESIWNFCSLKYLISSQFKFFCVPTCICCICRYMAVEAYNKCLFLLINATCFYIHI